MRTLFARLIREGVALNRQPAATSCPLRPFTDRARRCPCVDDFPGRSAASKHSATWALGEVLASLMFVRCSVSREHGTAKKTQWAETNIRSVAVVKCIVHTFTRFVILKAVNTVFVTCGMHDKTWRHGDMPTNGRTDAAAHAGRRKHPRAGPCLRTKP